MGAVFGCIGAAFGCIQAAFACIGAAFGCICTYCMHMLHLAAFSWMAGWPRKAKS